jgi:hypothetical protein
MTTPYYEDGTPEALRLSTKHGEGWVAGYCPACRRESLNIMAGGHVSCSHLDCTNPTAVDDILHDHIATRMVLALIAAADSGPQEWCGKDGCLAVGWDHDHDPHRAAEERIYQKSRLEDGDWCCLAGAETHPDPCPYHETGRA